jgi:hypothetical protein
MKRIKQFTELSLLALGALVTVATSKPPEDMPYASDEWVVKNLYDGQTGVATDIEIRLALGTWDFDVYDGQDTRGAKDALESIRFYRADDESAVNFTLKLGDEDSLLSPFGLTDDTEYVLDLSPAGESIQSDRFFPGPIHFRTGSLPRVTGLWRNDDTLLIVFSEPMDETDLFLGHASVDIFWQDDDALKSVVGDLNLADFVTQTDERLFMVAPVDFLDNAWVKVSGMVVGESGETLDGDGDGASNGAGDDFLEPVQLNHLPECFTREDIPAPCVAEDDVPVVPQWM